MNVEKLAIDRAAARELYQKYKTHQHYETAVDREIKRAYQLIAQGKVIIKAIEAIKQAGLSYRSSLMKISVARLAWSRQSTITPATLPPSSSWRSSRIFWIAFSALFNAPSTSEHVC